VLNETRPPHVLMLAASLEQSLALVRQLPDWSLLVGPDVPLDGHTAEQVQRKLEIPSPLRPGAVHAVTTANALGVDDLRHFDVLIRADRKLDLPRHTVSSLVEHDLGAPRPLVIVDCASLDYLGRCSGHERRQELYDERGWPAPGRDPLLCRVRRFLARRPRRKGL